ncbi:MAG TPA: glycosyltransferase family 1 protein [Mesotoga sp.]|nr:glycosyltransferase family 1 protein [Mesotoga sp.]
MEEVVLDYPIRVLHVVSKMSFGGVQSFIMNYYRHIDRSRVQFDFTVQSTEKGEFDEEIIMLGGRIHRIAPLYIDRKHFTIDLEALLTSCPEYRIIHTHQNFMNIVPLAIAKQRRIPVRISHSHSNYRATSISKTLQRAIFRKSIRFFATDCLACSKSSGKWLYGSSFGKHDNDAVIHNAIDLDHFTFNQEIRREIRNKLSIQDKYAIMHVGMFSPVKNHGFLLEIFNEFHKQNERSVLVLVGDGKGRATIEDKIHRLDLDEFVLLLGIRNDIPHLLMGADCFVFPSANEGFPVAVVEAQATGVPCLVSKEAVPPETNITGNVHFLSINDNPKYWANRIFSLSDGFVRRDMSELVTSSGYDIKTESEKLENFYVKMAKKG